MKSGESIMKARKTHTHLSSEKGVKFNSKLFKTTRFKGIDSNNSLTVRYFKKH